MATLFEWDEEGVQAIGVYKNHLATIDYVSGEKVFILFMSISSTPLYNITEDYIQSYEEAKQLADYIITNYEAKKEQHKHRNEQFKRFMRNIGLPIDTI